MYIYIYIYTYNHHIYVYMHTPGLLSMQLHMFGHLLYITTALLQVMPPKGLDGCSGAQDFSIGRLREEKSNGHRNPAIQLSRVSNRNLTILHRFWSIRKVDGRVSFPLSETYSFWRALEGWRKAEAVRWEARKMCSATRFAWI